MEAMMKGPLVVKEERRIESIDHHEEDGETRKLGSEEQTIPDTDSLQSFSPNRKESCFIKEEDQLKSTKAEMGEVREENERLKMILSRIVKDYQSLQVKFFDALQHEPAKKKTECTPSIPHDVEECELVSLSLGTSLIGQKEEKMNTSKAIEEYGMEKGLVLGLDCKYESSSSGRNEPTLNLSPENSFEEHKDEETGEPLPPSKIPKNPRTGDDEVSQQIQVKKARVSVRARCDAPTMHDGCQWRKYGQKIAKGNPCPRAYYRCTVAPACPVRKQVQRCAEDMSILITTYEGTHNHPLPISATAMASTTSAAATILMSGASPPSLPAIGCPSSSSAPTNPSLHSFNFGGSLQNTGASQLYLPNPRISSSLSHPTITLDLTTPPPPPPPSTSQPSQLYNNRFSSSFTSNTKYPSSSLDFSSLESSINPIPWSNGYLAYGPQFPYNNTHIGSFINLNGRQSSQDHLSLKSTNSTNSSTSPAQNPLTDTIAKAITSDPSFQSALMSAITSYVGIQGGGDQSLNHCLKWGEKFNSVTSSNGCASSYLTRSTPSNSNPQQENLMLLQPSLPYSASKSASASPVDNNENIN